MRRRKPAVALAFAAAAAVPLLGGCGIQETDAIAAGGPASVQAFLDRDYDMLLFFRAPDGGMVPVIERTSFSTVAGAPDLGDLAVPDRTEKALAALLSGPREQDRAAGLTTALPAARRGATARVDLSSDDRVTIRLPFALEGLNDTAIRQLTCTIAYSQDADGQVLVELTGQDGASKSGTCGLAAGNTGNTGNTGDTGNVPTETGAGTETGARTPPPGTNG